MSNIDHNVYINKRISKHVLGSEISIQVIIFTVWKGPKITGSECLITYKSANCLPTNSQLHEIHFGLFAAEMKHV